MVARVAYTTRVPSPESLGSTLDPVPAWPAASTLTHRVVPAVRSRRCTWSTPFPHAGSRLVAGVTKAIRRPSPLIVGCRLAPVPGPAAPWLTHPVAVVCMSVRTICWSPFAHSGARFWASVG